MTTIIKNIEFTVSDTSVPKKETIEYFIKSGFNHIDKSTDRKLKFERGSIASNMWTFNPLKWKSEIDIEINGKEVKGNFKINTIGQIPTHKEEIVWDFFIDNYKKYLNDRNYDFETENNNTLRMTKNSRLEYVGWAILGGLIGGIPAGLVAHLTGLNSIVSIGAASGAIAVLTKKINYNKRKNTL